jgi:hypothetical protein
VSLFDFLRGPSVSPGQLRQEIYLLGGRHQGDALAGARAELKDDGLTSERRALLRAVEAHLAAGKSPTADDPGRAGLSDVFYLAIILGSGVWVMVVVRSLAG